jgi:crotonobetainyl-CoA:carnitine CoA-transferase CaiB-like acyl-CoA transferase
VERVVPTRLVEELLPDAALLHMPISRVGEAPPAWPVLRLARAVGPIPRPLRVVDLSALWAGPLAGGLLAQAGAAVVKVESLSRPDPSPKRTPDLDRRLNGLKQRMTLALTDPAVAHMIDNASVLITSGRPHALARAGLEPERLFSRNPGLLWIAITSHGAIGEQAMRVGFGDDCAAAGGLLAWRDGTPSFMGDALADPCCGLIAAIAALECLAERQAGLLDVSLAGCAAWIADAMAQLQ